METLKDDYTQVIVTHNMQQAARISDCTAFFLLGEIIEVGETKRIFEVPKMKSTRTISREGLMRSTWGGEDEPV